MLWLLYISNGINSMLQFKANLRRRQIDEILSKYRDLPFFKKGYIREIRDALQMSSPQLAKLLGISESTVRGLEQSERNGTITLNSLEKVGKALNCRLVYALVPETTLDKTIKQRAQMIAERDFLQVNRSMELEDQSLKINEQAALLNDQVQYLVQNAGRRLWDQI